MNFVNLLKLPVLALAIAFSALGYAQSAPGEDPLKITGKVEHFSSPNGPAPRSGSLEGSGEMPAWLKAKVARYEAKAFSASADDGTMLTDKDVTNTSATQGLRRSCNQDLGSTTTTARPGRPGNNQQIVVLRGDVVNVCR
jgi:hypothetical protein